MLRLFFDESSELADFDFFFHLVLLMIHVFVIIDRLFYDHRRQHVWIMMKPVLNGFNFPGLSILLL